MIIHVEYVNAKKVKALFSVLAHKYGSKLAGFCFHFDKAAPLAPYRLLRKKVAQIIYRLPISALNKKLVALCNQFRMDLEIVVDKPLTAAQQKVLHETRRAVLVYAQTQDLQTLAFLNEQPQLLVCTPTQNDGLRGDLFHLAVHGRAQYQCKCSSCLANVLYIDKQDEVSFCPFYPAQSKLCNVDYPDDYFNCDAFIEILEKEIDKREQCKRDCAHYAICHGGCAMENVCATVKQEYPAAVARASEIRSQQTPLDQLPVFEQEAILRGVSQGK